MAQSNIFEAGAAEIPELFADYIEGCASSSTCIALALSTKPLGDDARVAIQKSLDALGFGSAPCVFVTLSPTASDASDGVELDARALFLLIEGMDPLRLIATDAHASESLALAYRTDITPDSSVRLFGRPSACFQDLDELLKTSEGKQKAWALFKTLA